MDQKKMKKQAEEALEQGKAKAVEILEDGGKMDQFLAKLEQKLKEVPKAGIYLSEVPLMVSMVKDYAQKDYPDVPLGTIIAIIAAFLYLINPADLIPDVVPVMGLVDDAAVLAACLALTKSDLDDYSKWREENK